MKLLPAVLALLVCTAWVGAYAKTPVVGGAAMYPSKTFSANLVNSNDHTDLVTAWKAAGALETLNGNGPYTVFAPTNEAFAKLPPGTMDRLLRPENKQDLAKTLDYHVVAGRFTLKAMKKLINKGRGKAQLKTLEGENLIVSMQDGALVLLDGKQNRATVTSQDIPQSNGILYVTSAVLEP